MMSLTRFKNIINVNHHHKFQLKLLIEAKEKEKSEIIEFIIYGIIMIYVLF